MTDNKIDFDVVVTGQTEPNSRLFLYGMQRINSQPDYKPASVLSSLLYSIYSRSDRRDFSDN